MWHPIRSRTQIEKGITMWDTVDTSGSRLSHDLPCSDCGHALHTYLACSDTCDCVPTAVLAPALIR